MMGYDELQGALNREQPTEYIPRVRPARNSRDLGVAWVDDQDCNDRTQVIRSTDHDLAIVRPAVRRQAEGTKHYSSIGWWIFVVVGIALIVTAFTGLGWVIGQQWHPIH